MKAIDILIVDDEQPARKKIRSYLKGKGGINSIIEAENGVEAVRMIKEKTPDLIFLDIQMPGMNGFEVIETIGADSMPVVVFVTAYDQYAIDAFEVQAVDYLLKPFHEERFKKSYNRALEQVQVLKDQSRVIKKLLEEIRKEKKYITRVMVKTGQRLFFIKTDDIIQISAEGKYVNIHTREDQYLLRETMLKMEECLDPAKFARIHRSTIINIDYIHELQPWFHGDHIVVLKDGTKLTLSRRFRDRLLERL